MPQWSDVYFREILGDIGEIPKAEVLSCSPDVIPVGNCQIEDPNQYFLIDNWNKDVGKELGKSEINYIYLRAYNLSSGNQTGHFELFYCKANLLLFPYIWRNNQLKTISGNEPFAVFGW